MRIRHIRFFLTVAAFLVISSVGRAEDFTKNYGLKFNSGIGFYYVTNGVPIPLTWVKHKEDQAKESDIVRIPTDVQFYSYGLDFSVGDITGPKPPHILGYGLSIVDTNGVVQGRWAARFVPVAGYDQKVYRIMFEGPYDDLCSDKLQYQFWEFVFPGDDAFLFHFATPKFVEEQEKRAEEAHALISQALSNKDKAYNGMFSRPGATFTDGVTPFQIHFSSYDEKMGKVDGYVSGFPEAGESVAFDGQLVGGSQLTLTQRGGGFVWDLQLSGGKNLIGTYPNGLLTSQVEIMLEDAPTN